MPKIDDLFVFLAGDYSGIEVRLLCIASGDELLTQQFNSGYDVHSLVGHELTGVPAEKIKNDEVTRRKIKGFHFGLIYGLGLENGPGQLQSQGTPITKAEFAQYHRRYFERYKGVKAFVDRCHRQAEVQGYVETIFGFRRYVQKGESSRGTYYLNQAVNSPIQGAAHQLVLIAMALLKIKPTTYRLLSKPVLEVHDELVFRVRLGDIVEADQKLRALLQEDVPAYISRNFKSVKMSIPLVAEAKAGFTRGTMVKYEDGNIPSVEQFLEDWRAKYRKVAATPLTSLIPE